MKIDYRIKPGDMVNVVLVDGERFTAVVLSSDYQPARFQFGRIYGRYLVAWDTDDARIAVITPHPQNGRNEIRLPKYREQAVPGDVIKYTQRVDGENDVQYGVVLRTAFEPEYFYIAVYNGEPQYGPDEIPLAHSVVRSDNYADGAFHYEMDYSETYEILSGGVRI